MIGDGQGEGLRGIEQGVLEQDGGRAANQLAERRGRVGEAEGELVRVACCVLREGLLGWRRAERSGLV
jgi:hypothetical protein